MDKQSPKSKRPAATDAEPDSNRAFDETRLTDAARHAVPRAEPDLPEKFGRYHILRKIGQGGMGAVYLAHDGQLDRQVALKVPHLSAAGKDVLDRFHREARAAATVRHPNLCPVFDVGQIDGRPYLTMAFIEGRPLSKIISEVSPQKPLSQRQVALLVRKLALALAEAHRHGIVHRDLKPANVMLDRRREPIIMDFGLARRAHADEVRITQSGALMGSPAYMSPEQVRGEIDAVGPPSDIYSLGVILYELLTCNLPFQGPVAAVLGQILTVDPPPLAELRRNVDPALAAICKKAMARSIEARYASMTEMAQALGAFLKGNQPSGTAAPAPAVDFPELPGDADLPALTRRGTVDATDVASRGSRVLPKGRGPILAAVFGGVAAVVATALLVPSLLVPARDDPVDPAARSVGDASDKGDASATSGERPTDTVPSVEPPANDRKPATERSETATATDTAPTGETRPVVVSTPWTGDDHVTWDVLDPIRFASSRGATIQKLADRSLLAGGTLAADDSYLIEAHTNLNRISGVRLEVLEDESLPGSGPGRAAWVPGAFSLSKVEVLAGGLDDDTPVKALRIRDASADFGQVGCGVRNLIDGNFVGPNACWAVGIGETLASPSAHVAILELAPYEPSTGGQRVSIRLSFLGLEPLGRFRLSVTDGNHPALGTLDPQGYEREAARWILGEGGGVFAVPLDGIGIRVQNSSDLPTEPFFVGGIGGTGKWNSPILPADVERLARCSDMRFLGIYPGFDSKLPLLQAFPNVESVELVRARLSDDAVAALPPLPNLQNVLFVGATGFGAKGLSVLRRWPQIQLLNFDRFAVNAEILDEVARLPRLWNLNLAASGISDADLEHLRPLKQCHTLNLSGTNNQIAGPGLRALSGIKALWGLELTSTPATDAAVAPLRDLPELRSLCIGYTKISDKGLREFIRDKDLEQLHLPGTGMTSSGIAELHQLKSLTHLDLSATKIDDNALPHLKKLAGLKWLGLRESLLSPGVVKQLHAALPDCDIQFSRRSGAPYKGCISPAIPGEPPARTSARLQFSASR